MLRVQNLLVEKKAYIKKILVPKLGKTIEVTEDTKVKRVKCEEL